ncbi:O-Glycosyl hydrolase family 30 [Cooperia oncophora]
MKTNGHMKGGGKLKGEEGGQYYQTYANYFIRFFEEYHKNGVDFWGVTVQNEPMSGLNPDYGWQTMYFSAAMERDFIKNLLGPALKASPYTKDISLMINDDQRYNLPGWADTILNDADAAKYVAGIGVHWYADYEVPVAVLTATHDRHPDYFILGTEVSLSSDTFESTFYANHTGRERLALILPQWKARACREARKMRSS